MAARRRGSPEGRLAPAGVLYLGDTTLAGAARYLACVLAHLRLAFDYVPSARRVPAGLLDRPYRLYILSDYPSRHLSAGDERRVASAVRGGASLLMIGGWASFAGPSGGYGRRQIADLLPVRCLGRDDREQGAAAYRIVAGRAAREFAAFDFAAAPGICGFNRVAVRPGAREILRVATLRFGAGGRVARAVRTDPLLVVGACGRGRVGALTTDLAPHWVGGLVDWGRRRLRLRRSAAVACEVGDAYVRFVRTVLGLFL